MLKYFRVVRKWSILSWRKSHFVQLLNWPLKDQQKCNQAVSNNFVSLIRSPKLHRLDIQSKFWNRVFFKLSSQNSQQNYFRYKKKLGDPTLECYLHLYN